MIEGLFGNIGQVGINEKISPVGPDQVPIWDSVNQLFVYVQVSNLVSNVVPVQENHTITGDEDDFAFDDVNTINQARFDLGGSDRTFTGFVPPSPPFPKEITLLNADGSGTLKIPHNDGGSVAINRVLCPDNAEYQYKRNSNDKITYDTTSLRWRIISAPQ